MNEVSLSNWEGQPVHCPFCGTSLGHDESLSCKHLLYVISSGEFCSRSDRLDEVLGLDSGFYPELSPADKAMYGTPDEVAKKVRHSFHTQMEFQYESNWNLILIGFAAYESELSYWGHVPESPYDE